MKSGTRKYIEAQMDSYESRVAGWVFGILRRS